MKPFNLLEGDALHLAMNEVKAVPGFDHDYERYLKTHCTRDDAGRLVSIHETQSNWDAWELHPAGDEVVIVLHGRARFIQDLGGEQRVVVVGPNEAIVNPAGTPHTADVLEPFVALYITPCPGTQHRPRTRSDLTGGRSRNPAIRT
jgi:mannose-6-phosphate isomerase-like protein (cupin superfamily)